MLFKGSMGDKGMKGEQGKKGDQGIPVRYYHIVLKNITIIRVLMV